MQKPVRVHGSWLENKIADLWPAVDTATIAEYIGVDESWVANALARMRDRNDPRLRSVTSR